MAEHRPDAEHAWFTSRLEGFRRAELSPVDQATLAGHVAECAECRAWLSLADREDSIMQSVADNVVSGFDFERARRGTENLIAVRGRETRVLLGVVAAYCLLGVGSIALTSPRHVWLSLAAVLVFVGVPLVLLVLKDRVVAARARKSLTGPAPELSARRFESRVRNAMTLFQLNRAAIALGAVLWGGYAFSAASGHASIAGLVMLVVLAAAAPWLWRRWLAPAAVRLEEDLIRGRITLAQHRAATAIWRRREERTQ